MTLLSNTDIIRHLTDTKAIVIEPYNPSALGNVSYDLTLGPTIARYDKLKAHVNLETDQPSNMFSLESYDDGFLLTPGERVLAHSREIAGGRQVKVETDWYEPGVYGGPARRTTHTYAVTTQLHCTSTAARIGLSVCACAGFGDVGYISPWTLELQNNSPRVLWLPIGAVIAQVSFAEVTPILDGTSYEFKGSYQSEDDPVEILKSWHPSMMLPKKLKVRL